MKTIITNFLKWFLIINTGILLIVGINTFRYDSISTMIIPQIFAASFATAAVTTAFFSLNPKKPIKPVLRVFIVIGHYLVLCAIIMVLGNLFDWFSLTLKGALGMALSVAGVYIVTAVISIILSRGEAKAMTDALKKFNEEE
ncbi:MAG: hypothetical protein K5669_12370 [Lachnospiraceae bacterium]|nr:hypothetical protein [Lachnospiraceae bacterium]